MSIRYKLLVFFLLQHFIFFMSAFLFSEFFIRPYNLAMEESSVLERIKQIKNVFQTELEHLRLLNKDWAVWDETYAFVNDHNEAYIRSNFTPDILNSINLNRIELFDLSGKSVYINDDGTVDPTDISKIVNVSPEEMKKARSGVMQFKEKVALVSVTPILKGEDETASDGLFLMLRSIDKKMLDKLNKSTNAHIVFIPPNDFTFLDQLRKKGVYTKIIDDKHLQVDTFLEGLDGNASTILEVTLTRDFVIESEKLILYLYAFGAVFGILSFIVSFYLLRRGVVHPLNQLVNHIVQIRENESYISSNLEDRKDEIGLLAREFNALLGKLETTNNTLSLIARIDTLTGLANRMDLEERFEQIRRQSCREEKAFSILMLDIDYFKKYNDTYGHVKGDEVLSLVARTIKHSLSRPYDYVARYGGEEFIVLLPETDAEGSTAVAKRILQNVQALEIIHESSMIEKKIISVSIGCLTRIARKEDSAAFLIHMADKALYSAKEKGRNSYMLYD